MPIQNSSHAKPYTLEFEPRPEYLYAYVKGEKDSLEISLQYWKEIADECRRTGYKNFLLKKILKKKCQQLKCISSAQKYRILVSPASASHLLTGISISKNLISSAN